MPDAWKAHAPAVQRRMDGVGERSSCGGFVDGMGGHRDRADGGVESALEKGTSANVPDDDGFEQCVGTFRRSEDSKINLNVLFTTYTKPATVNNTNHRQSYPTWDFLGSYPNSIESAPLAILV